MFVKYVRLCNYTNYALHPKGDRIKKMFMTRPSEGRWMRRYRLFFLIGTVILSFQIYLAIKFFTIHERSRGARDRWNPHESLLDIADVENSVNSARRSKDGFMFDDEDIASNNAHSHNKQRALSNKSKSSSAQKLNKTVLRLEELDFIPACDIITKEAILAIHRAKTQKCKQEIANITCLIQQGLLYPKRLPNTCPKESFVAGKSLGCYKDDKTYRLLTGYFSNFKTTNSPEYCMNMCLQSGYPYAGVQYSTECFCGVEEPPATARLPDSSCNMKCPANPHLACGGYFTINIFETGVARFTPQIPQVTTPVGIKPVRIVFLLTLNGRAVRQVRRLLKMLFHKNHYFYIHVDSRQDYLFRELLFLEQKFSNIKLARKRFSTIWGGASLLRMILASMKHLLASSWQWDFLINLSESDLPVKTVDRLVDFLAANREKNFVKSHGREVQRFIQKQGLDKTFVECDAHMWRTGDRKLPWGVQMDGGSDWIALSRPFVTYVASENPDALVEGLLIVFDHTLLPAESFFHTVLRNSKFCHTYVDNNLHVTNWKRKLGCKCQYKHVVDWCGCSPNDFKPDDWLRIQGTENKQLYFARKFEPVVNQAVILQVEEWLYGPLPINVPNINSYWQSEYHYADLNPPADDALITVAHSLIRIKLKTILNNKCTCAPLKIVEVTSYFVKDNYEGALIMHEVNITNMGKMKFETFVQLKHHFVASKTNPLAQRLLFLSVSSDYDMKEQMFRNFAHILGPFSEPVLLYQFVPNLSSTASYNISFLWIDPAGHLNDISEASIDTSQVIGYVKPSFKPPLLPGEWHVKVIHSKQFVAETKFLITPLEFMSGVSLSQKQSVFIHSGADSNIKNYELHESYLQNSSIRDSLERKAEANSRRFGVDLQEWIESLTEKFYSIGKTCVVGLNGYERIKCGNNEFKSCSLTNWSSQAPDPKSYVGAIDETSGYLKRW